MSLRSQQAAEVVRPAARFHRHDAAWKFRRERYDTLTPHPPTQYDPPGGVQTDRAAAVLAQVHPKYLNVHRLTLRLPTRTS